MPELPEVETIVRGLSTAIYGQRIGSIRLSCPDIVHGSPQELPGSLRGQTIERITRRGKRIRLDVSSDWWVVFHLGMSGQLFLAPSEQTVEPHTHLRIGLTGYPHELRFRDPRRFGGIWFARAPRTERQAGLSPLGLEPLDVPRVDFRRMFTRRRQIKALLLDQNVIAGLGNIYVDELLHRAGIHPRQLAGTLTRQQVDLIWRQMRTLLRRAIQAGGSSIQNHVTVDGRPGHYQRFHRVYGRHGQPCVRCQTPIRKSLVAGRGTHFCPRCQPEV